MQWRFYLIDRNNNKTRHDEPIGWESFLLKIKRHEERHGTFKELQVSSFQYTDHSKDLLKEEYDTYGVRGNYTQVIEGKCGNSWEEMYRGKVAFDTYKFICADFCYVSIQLEQIGVQMKFLNRLDQKIDLTKSEALDGAALTDYPGLSKNILLPSKAILLRTIAKNSEMQSYRVSDDSGWFPVASTGQMQGSLSIPFTLLDVNNIKDFEAQAVMDYYNHSNYQEYFPELIYNNPDQDLNCISTAFDISFRVKGRYKNLVSGSGEHILTLALKRGTDNFISNGITMIQGWAIHSADNNNVLTQAFDITYAGTATLAPGEKLYIGIILTYTKFTNYAEEVTIEIDPETFFTASVVSKCDPTFARLSLINETASRVIESLTGNELKLYSEYYGRVDSLPYAHTEDGCGSLRALTTGLDIRRAKMADESDPRMFLSMKDIFESLSAIDNIGMGFEGEDKVRLEPWKYFYQDQLVYTCRNIEKLERSIKPEDHYSIFKNGYDKWESEDYNGLDEFLTKREWLTSLSEVQNTLEKMCRFIASGYAWEVTRRKGTDSKDWRYDNDNFIACLVNYFKGVVQINGSADYISFPEVEDLENAFNIGDEITLEGTASNDGTYTITDVTFDADAIQLYTGVSMTTEIAPGAKIKNLTSPFFRIEVGNVADATNILDPDTVYNFRISPARNAMRWFNRVAACYRGITSADKLKFSAGDGNFLAEGLLQDGCVLEAAAMAENDDLSLDSFNNTDDAAPIYYPERVAYNYPLSFQDYNIIKANPHGLIRFISKCEQGYGWIDSIEYNPEAGVAKFVLIPKV